MRFKTKSRLAILSTFAILSTGMVAFALTALFTQTFPGQTFTTTTSTSTTTTSALGVLSEGSCGDSLVLDTTDSVIQSQGQGATLVYACGATSATPAFTTSNVGGQATPTFTVPTGWSLGIITTNSPGLCSGSPQSVEPLSSGASISFGTSLSYVYCLTAASASDFTSFSVTWSQ